MVHLTLLDQACYAFQHRTTFTKQAALDQAIALLEWEVLSNRQVAAITGVSIDRVNAVSKKTDKRGGTLDVNELPAIRDLRRGMLRGDDVRAETVRILAGETTSTMLARLSGLSQSTISRWARSAA